MFPDPMIKIPHQRLYVNCPEYLLEWVDLIDKIEQLQGTPFPGKSIICDYDHIEGLVSIMLLNCFLIGLLVLEYLKQMLIPWSPDIATQCYILY